MLLVEQQGLAHDDDDEELDDELYELALFDGELKEKLQDMMLDETLLLLQLEDIQLPLKLSKLLEQQ